MPLGKVLYESGDVQRHVYFPTDSIVSFLYVMENGASAEVSVVGNEGVIGISLFMGGETTPSRAIVQSAGHAYRLVGQRLKDEFQRNGGMQILLLRYTQALITQMAQTAVCNRHHSVDQQLCRWLLLSLDRLSSNQLVMTQDLIGDPAQHLLDAPLLVVGWHDDQDLARVPLGSLCGGEVFLRVLPYGQAGDDLAAAAARLPHPAQEVQIESEEQQYGDREQCEATVLEAEQPGEDPTDLRDDRDQGHARGDE